MRTIVFAHKGFIGIKSSITAEGLVNNPASPGELGSVIDADYVDISPEALELLKTISKGRGSFGEIMIFKTNDDKRMFSWMGGHMIIINPKETKGDRDYDPSILTSVDGIEVPEDFKAAIDGVPKEEEEKEDMIKVFLNGESVWAARLSAATAEIRNLPIDERVNYMDKVAIDEERQFLRVIERQYEQVGITYDHDPATLPEEWARMGEYLLRNDMSMEGMVVGNAMICFGKGIPHDDISKILDNAPLRITSASYKKD